VALVERLRLELGPEVQVVANLWPLGDRQTREDPDQDWLVDYQGLTLAECIRSAQQAARPYQVLEPDTYRDRRRLPAEPAEHPGRLRGQRAEALGRIGGGRSPREGGRRR